MEYFDPVVFKVEAKVGEAIAGFGAVNKELSTMAKNGTLATAGVGKIEAAAKFAKIALVGMAGAFGVLAVSSISVLDKVEKSQANLATAVNNTGVNYQAAEPIFQSHADTMTKLGFTYDQTYAALAKMTAATGSPQVALNALAAAADLARAKNMSLADAGDLLARSSAGQARGLADLGIKMGVTIPKGASLAQILALVETKVGGAARAFGATFTGRLQVFNAQLQQLQYGLGVALLPALNKAVDWFNTKGLKYLKEFFGYIESHKKTVTDLAAALGGLYLGGKVAAGITAVATAVTGLNKALEGGAILKLIQYMAPILRFVGGTAGLTVGLLALATKRDLDIINQAKTTKFTGNIYAAPTAVQQAGKLDLSGKGVSKISAASKSGKTSIKAQERGQVQNAPVVNVHIDNSKAVPKAIKTGSTKGK